MMKTTFMKKALLGSLLMSGAFAAAAAPVAENKQTVISVSGNIIQSQCAIAAADLNKTVELGDARTDDLSAGTYIPVYFSFNIYGCDAALTSATATVTGTTADSDVPGYGTGKALSNTGTATGVAVGLLGKDSVASTATGALPVGDASAALALADDGNGSKGGVLSLGAQIIPVATATPAAAGTVISTATVTFTYS
ncbi:fimbrial protein [Enterobacter mori]|uniref:fimbrial protein n=1 Tax=Enterobacter mori TaxID=539813 RepID=UPI003B843C51